MISLPKRDYAIHDVEWVLRNKLVSSKEIRKIIFKVALTDLGVGWGTNGDNPQGFSRFPGLSSLVAIEPGLFQERGNTRVSRILAFMTSHGYC